MFLSEEQVRYFTAEFMPKLKAESISAIIDVACNGFSILASAQKYKLSHQSLSKNLSKLKVIQCKIAEATSLLPKPYLLKENAHALLLSETSFRDAKRILIEFCETFGGRYEVRNLNKGINLYLDGTVTCVFLNPDKSYEREWSFDQNETS